MRRALVSVLLLLPTRLPAQEPVDQAAVARIKDEGLHRSGRGGSWLNQAELELSLVSRGCLGRRRLPDLVRLRRETQAWTIRGNRAKTRIRWQFTRRDARGKFGYQENPYEGSRT